MVKHDMTDRILYKTDETTLELHGTSSMYYVEYDDGDDAGSRDMNLRSKIAEMDRMVPRSSRVALNQLGVGDQPKRTT